MWLSVGYTIPQQGDRNLKPGTLPFESTDKFLFDGNDGFLRSVTLDNYRFEDELTLSCWVTFGDSLFDFTPTSTVKNFMIIDQSKTNNLTGYSLFVTRNPNSNQALLRFQVGKDQATPFPAADYRAQIRIDNIADVESKTFFIMASVRNDTIRLSLRANGVSLNNSKTLTDENPIAYDLQTNAFCIGNTSPTASNEFAGNIDEVGVFNQYLNNANADAIFNWDQNGNLQKYSNNNSYTLAAWYRMGEYATYTPNTETYNLLSQTPELAVPIVTQDGVNIVSQAFTENIGVWRLKNAVDLNNANLDLVSFRLGAPDPTIGFLPLNAKTEPGLPPPT